MTFEEALQLTDITILLSTGFRWLVWETDVSEWAVYERRPYARSTTAIISTEDANMAIRFLLKHEETKCEPE